MTKKNWCLSIAALACLLLGLDPLNLWPLSWLAFFLLFLIALDPAVSYRHLALHTLMVSAVSFAYGLYWINFYSPEIFVFVFLCLIPFIPIYFMLFRYLTTQGKNPTLTILTAPLLWIALQKIYYYSPFGTMALEVPFYGPFAFFQITSVTGFHAHAALVIGLNISLALAIQKRSRAGMFWAIFFVTLLTFSYIWGTNELKKPWIPKEEIPKKQIKVSLIQHNLPVDMMWNIANTDTIRQTYQTYGEKAGEKHPDLILFPLYDITDDVFRQPERFAKLAQETKASILLGTYIPDHPDQNEAEGFYDTAILYSPEGKMYDYYIAGTPPPFRYLRKAGEINNKKYKSLNSPFGKLGIHLCYESGLGRVTKNAVREGAGILISLSNPGYFNRSHLPYYHLMQDRLRALESGRPMIRVASNGVSALIDPKGRIVEVTKLDEEGLLFFSVGSENTVTPYYQYGDVLSFLGLIWIFGLFLNRKRKGKRIA